MKLDRTEVAVLVVTVVIIVTVNSWWRVRETGRRAHLAALQEPPSRDAGDEGTAETQREGGY